ncbi:MAG: hypothetical protein JRJ69_10350 [Deltaproteobacteria bacterium]|nr:hypothetical protein [Deltaproteobacteria bacterium]
MTDRQQKTLLELRKWLEEKTLPRLRELAQPKEFQLILKEVGNIYEEIYTTKEAAILHSPWIIARGVTPLYGFKTLGDAEEFFEEHFYIPEVRIVSRKEMLYLQGKGPDPFKSFRNIPQAVRSHAHTALCSWVGAPKEVRSVRQFRTLVGSALLTLFEGAKRHYVELCPNNEWEFFVVWDDGEDDPQKYKHRYHWRATTYPIKIGELFEVNN